MGENGIVVDPKIVQQISYWIHDEECCVTIDRIVECFGVRWDVASFVLKNKIAKPDQTYQIYHSNNSSGAATPDCSEHKTPTMVFRLNKSYWKCNSNNDNDDEKDSTNASLSSLSWCAMAIDCCSESIHTAHQRDFLNFQEKRINHHNNIAAVAANNVFAKGKPCIYSNIEPSKQLQQAAEDSIQTTTATKLDTNHSTSVNTAATNSASNAAGNSASDNTFRVQRKKVITASDFFGKQKQKQKQKPEDNHSDTNNTSNKNKKEKEARNSNTKTNIDAAKYEKANKVNNSTSSSSSVTTNDKGYATTTTNTNDIKSSGNDTVTNSQKATVKPLRLTKAKPAKNTKNKSDIKSSQDGKENMDEQKKNVGKNATTKSNLKKSNKTIGNADDFTGDMDDDEDDDSVVNDESFKVKQRENQRQQRRQQQRRQQQPHQEDSEQKKIAPTKNQKATTETTRRRKRLVDKTFLDDNGYLRTETQEIWEEVTEDTATANTKSSRESPKKKPKVSSSNPTTATNTKKQKSIMGFFAKRT